mgnify:CR=1 FL=1
MYAYDYDLKNVIRFFGSDLKPALYKKIKSMSNIQIFDRVMATSLLNKNNEVGNKVIGATGFNVRTGEFLIFSQKQLFCAQQNHYVYGISQQTYRFERCAR